ncbi:MAG TPA: DUF1697 domain-containing protein [Thermoanaerobaculia bacterium]|nr:DUF1697 domain-containing protein [Thermoanaerobaculia bacterium]
MSRYMAFLRAINVGGHSVPMANLRRLFEEAGGSDAETVIASGNVVFASSRSAAGLERRLSSHLEDRLGYAVAAFVRTPDEVAAISARWPFSSADAPRDLGVYVGFLHREPDAAARRRVLGLGTAEDALAFHGRELYWGRRGRFSDSKITGAAIERALGAPTTIRNTTTIRRIAERYSSA